MILHYYEDHKRNIIMILVLTPQPSEIYLSGQFDPQTERSERRQHGKMNFAHLTGRYVTTDLKTQCWSDIHCCVKISAISQRKGR